MINLKSIAQVENFDDKKFQKTFGVSKFTFATMMSVLQRRYIESHKKGGRKSKVTIFDRLCIFFAYYRDGRTIADIAVEYSLADSTTFDIIHLAENTLLGDKRFHLPSKRALLKKNNDMAKVDATKYSTPQKKQRLRRQKEKAHVKGSNPYF